MTEETRKSDSMPEIEFWFEYGSNYSYLTVMRIEDEAERYGVRIRWKPFLLGPIFKELGWSGPPFVVQKEKGAYVQRDMVRQCRKYGLKWTPPSEFPRLCVIPLRVALLGAEEPWIGDFSRRVMELNFGEDQDINDPGNIAAVLEDMHLPATDLLERAQAQSTKDRLREQTEAAREKQIFGAPTFFIGDEMFWGDDRLEDALRFAAGDQ